VDETGWRQAGQPKRSWLWTVVTRYVTLFRIAPSRASQVARDRLGEHYAGVAGTDRYSAYTWLAWRQFCWSHLLRDFQKILERGGDSYRIGWNLKLQAEYLLMLWARVRDGTLSYTDFLTEFPVVQALIRHWLTIGLGATSSRTTATCRQLLDGDPSLWLFATRSGVEPTNNSAERALRHPVIWRRTSHGTQSDLGSQFVERILSVVETCRQQQRPVFDFLRQALIAYRAGLPAPSLLPALQP
jgi:transposase